MGDITLQSALHQLVRSQAMSLQQLHFSTMDRTTNEIVTMENELELTADSRSLISLMYADAESITN